MLRIYMYSNHHLFRAVDHNYSTRTRDNIRKQFYRLTKCQQAISYAGPLIWNDIPIEIRNLNSLQLFKVHFKKHLISTYNSE